MSHKQPKKLNLELTFLNSIFCKCFRFWPWSSRKNCKGFSPYFSYNWTLFCWDQMEHRCYSATKKQSNISILNFVWHLNAFFFLPSNRTEILENTVFQEYYEWRLCTETFLFKTIQELFNLYIAISNFLCSCTTQKWQTVKKIYYLPKYTVLWNRRKWW